MTSPAAAPRSLATNFTVSDLQCSPLRGLHLLLGVCQPNSVMLSPALGIAKRSSTRKPALSGVEGSKHPYVLCVPSTDATRPPRSSHCGFRPGGWFPPRGHGRVGMLRLRRRIALRSSCCAQHDSFVEGVRLPRRYCLFPLAGFKPSMGCIEAGISFVVTLTHSTVILSSVLCCEGPMQLAGAYIDPSLCEG